MNRLENKTIRYAVAGLGVLALLIVVGRSVRRNAPATAEPPPVKAASLVRHPSPAAPSFAPDDPAPAESPPSPTIEPPATNVAAIYRQAFARYDALTKEQKELLGSWRTNVDAAVEAELCEKLRPICDLVRQAAGQTCDWGLEKPITVETRMPHLQACRNIARAAVWSAAHCRPDDPAGAVDDLVATVHLGRQVSPLLIGHIVGLVIQGLAIDFVTEHAGALAGTGAARLGPMLEDTHCVESLARAFEQEGDTIAGVADKLARMPAEEAAKTLANYIDNGSPHPPIDPAQAIADIRQAAELVRGFGKASTLSDADYVEAVAQAQAAAESSPFFAIFLPAIDQLVDRTQATTVKSAMAAAGLAVMRDGPGALGSHLDPATGRPFVLLPSDHGFELQSDYPVNGKPLTLPFH